MPMTHVPQMGAENPYQKTGAINRHENRACSIRYQKLIPEKFGIKLHVRRVRNRHRLSGTGFGADFCKCFTGINPAHSVPDLMCVRLTPTKLYRSVVPSTCWPVCRSSSALLRAPAAEARWRQWWDRTVLRPRQTAVQFGIRLRSRRYADWCETGVLASWLMHHRTNTDTWHMYGDVSSALPLPPKSITY